MLCSVDSNSKAPPATSETEISEIVESVSRKRYRFTARKIGELLRLKIAERRALKITTMQASDISEEEHIILRIESKRTRDRERAKRKRRADGAMTREEYLHCSLSQTEPWVLEGISRRTYQRRQRKDRDNSLIA